MVQWRRSQELESGASVTVIQVTMNAVKQQQQQQQDVEWDVMYERLQAFKDEEGHCNADRATSDPALGQWGESSRVVAQKSSLSFCFVRMS